MVEHFLQMVAASALSAGVVAFLAKSLIGMWLSRDLEAHRVKLEAESSRQLERLRADLSREQAEHQVRFSHLHVRRAEIVAEVFARLDQVHETFRDWIRPLRIGPPPDMKALAEKAINGFNDFVSYYYPRAIWLDPETCNGINVVLETLREPFYDFTINVDDAGNPKDYNAWLVIWRKIDKDIPEARRLLDRRFRELLGVTSSSAATFLDSTSERLDPRGLGGS